MLLVGAGSGLVPLMSMVRYAHARGRRKTVWLVCSAATYAHAFYRDELERLAAGRSWLRVVHCITRDPAERRAAYHRRIDGDVLREVLDGAVSALSCLCGPPAMVDAVSGALHGLGVDPGAVLSEKYD